MEENSLNGTSLWRILELRIESILGHIQVKRREARARKVLQQAEHLVEREAVVCSVHALHKVKHFDQHDALKEAQVLIGHHVGRFEPVEVAKHKSGRGTELAQTLSHLRQDGFANRDVLGVLG